jgi:hypothetical protein
VSRKRKIFRSRVDGRVAAGVCITRRSVAAASGSTLASADMCAGKGREIGVLRVAVANMTSKIRPTEAMSI